MADNVLVYLETDGDGLRKPSLEALGAGAALAASLGVEVHGVIAAENAAAVAETGRGHGATTIHVVEDAVLAHSVIAPHRRAVVAAAEACGAGWLLFAATVRGRDLLAHVAGQMSAGIAADATGVDVVDGAVHITRPMFAGKAMQVVAALKQPFCIGIRPNAFEAAGAGGSSEVVSHPLPTAAELPIAELRDVLAPEVQQVDLTEAEIVVSGGRGFKGPENFHLVEELAAALGGVVGASRAVVDAGWRPHGEQVGQTGKTVSPKLYVACAISGAIQHLAGMSSSKCIVAINKDADAPIFKVADYGIVGDVFEVLPALTAALGDRS
jgi:electron transfer flavoprotein alpha subunit